MDDKTLQQSLKTLGYYQGEPDGLMGPDTRAAILALLTARKVPYQPWNEDRRKLAARQIILTDMGFDAGEVDGLIGPSTRAAIEEWQNAVRDATPTVQPSNPITKTWPTQAQVPAFYGERGANQVQLQLPYEMKLAWDTSSIVRRMSCHEKVHDPLGRIFTRVLETYGIDAIRQLRLDYFGGCLNVRKMRGGNSWSMHSWGIAVDIDPDRNALRMDHTQAVFAKSEYIPWFEIWESEGAVSLGRERDYDWMHCQFARL